MSENSDLRQKLDEAKARLPLQRLMREVGCQERQIGSSAYCPFHSDEHKSFSVFQSTNGNGWQWKCHAGCGHGDEIDFIAKHFNISRREAIKCYLDMAGFPALVPPKSHEYLQSRKSREFPGSHGSHESPKSPVYPMSNGQGLDKGMEKDLKDLAAHNACTRADDVPEKKRFKLARDVRAIEKRIGRELTTAELVRTCEEWELASVPFLGWDDDDDHLGMFLAELTKVRVPTGEGDTIRKALEAVSNLSASELPAIPGYADARESWRRVAALHRELFRLSGGKTYFLGCRDAAKVHSGLSHQSAYNINLALAQLGVIKIVRVGDARENGRASKFRYLLSQGENGVEEDDGGLEI
jgi:CHC2 zinc finger